MFATKLLNQSVEKAKSVNYMVLHGTKWYLYGTSMYLDVTIHTTRIRSGKTRSFARICNNHFASSDFIVLKEDKQLPYIYLLSILHL